MREKENSGIETESTYKTVSAMLPGWSGDVLVIIKWSMPGGTKK